MNEKLEKNENKKTADVLRAEAVESTDTQIANQFSM